MPSTVENINSAIGALAPKLKLYNHTRFVDDSQVNEGLEAEGEILHNLQDPDHLLFIGAYVEEIKAGGDFRSSLTPLTLARFAQLNLMVGEDHYPEGYINCSQEPGKLGAIISDWWNKEPVFEAEEQMGFAKHLNSTAAALLFKINGLSDDVEFRTSFGELLTKSEENILRGIEAIEDRMQGLIDGVDNIGRTSKSIRHNSKQVLQRFLSAGEGASPLLVIEERAMLFKGGTIDAPSFLYEQFEGDFDLDKLSDKELHLLVLLSLLFAEDSFEQAYDPRLFWRPRLSLIHI